jgi:hypothetical protein
MNLLNQLMEELRDLPVQLQEQALSCIRDLRALDEDMDAIITENLEALEELAK